MYLKNIQLVGFKSFAEKTDVEFLRGVTAIVGPNGCGKSNVSDAIRWVLGEQSAKALRGDEMADVIFKGTDTRKAFGMAEVSLTFTECRYILKTGQLAGTDTNFEEVTVTRRIFRDGNSEYFLNKTPCRLKDIQTLFMDTGIGRSSYSIMEQGKIDKILSSHPEDRRAVFEEAAGITRFKSQKKEALRKLEYTEANLVRVADILKEVKRQIGSLQRQAGKARRYQVSMAELKHLDTQWGCHELEEIQSTMRSLEQEVADLRARTEDVRLEVEAGEGNITNLREQVNAAENRRQQILQSQRDIQSEIERHEIHIRTNADRISETHVVIQAATREAEEAHARSTDIQNLLASIRDNLKTASGKLQQQAIDLEHSQGLLRGVEGAEREETATVQRLQTALMGLEGVLANLRNQVSASEKQRQETGLRIQRVTGKRAITFEEQRRLSQRLESLQTEVHSYKNTFEASRHAITGGEDALREAENQCQLLAAKISEAQRLVFEKNSRREVLLQLHKSYEGYSDGAQALLRQTSNPSSNDLSQNHKDAILGTLANMIEVDPKFSTAIEAGLGQRLEAIVVSETQTALHLVNHLRNGELGRALFAIQRTDSACHSGTNLKLDPLPGSLCRACDVVKAQPVVESFVRQLLADMVIVQDLHRAIDLCQQHPGLTLITVEGDVLTHQGILSGGSGRASPLQLLGRRNEITALDSDIGRLETEIHDLSTMKEEWEGRRLLARQSLGDRQSELRFQENDLTRKETLLSAMQGELHDFVTQIAATDQEIQESEKILGETDAHLARIRQELTQAEANQTAVQSDLASARKHSDDLAIERHNLSVAVNDLRVAHATTQQQIQGMESQIQTLETQVGEIRILVASREADVRHHQQRIAQWEKETVEATRQIETHRKSAAGITGQLTEIEMEKSRLEGEVQTTTETIRTHRHRIDEIQKAETDHEIRLTEKRGDLNHLTERILREYGVDLTTLTLLPLKPDSKSGTASGEISDEPEAAPRPSVSLPYTFLAFAGWEEVALRIAELREKIQGMGAVNLEAVQEYDELEQRHTFLKRESEDLATSKEQLLEILRKINTTTRKIFAETFEKIRENFQTVFAELFGGGKADLILMDESDPLECGIEIVAKPPGKQLQSIMLLSGGEKTMTAVALLFAIYMVKPSPFCVLDEMDAPLDESNINRFVKMLERFLVQSQFVIITHNKRTIEMADALYGVTMEERGVSKLVSVKFHRKEDVTWRAHTMEGYQASENSASNGKVPTEHQITGPAPETTPVFAGEARAV